MAGQVKQTPGAIGYMELAYAKQNHLATAPIKNAAGEFVAPSIAVGDGRGGGHRGQAAANTDYRISIVNAPGAGAYPISSFTWLLVYRNQTDAKKRKSSRTSCAGICTTGENDAPRRSTTRRSRSR